MIKLLTQGSRMLRVFARVQKINNESCLVGISQFYDFEVDDFEAEFCRKMLP